VAQCSAGADRGHSTRAQWPVILLTVVVAASMQMVASGGPLTVMAPSSADHLVVTLRLASVIEAVVDRGGLLVAGT